MIAGDYPFVGKFTATHPPDHIPDCAELVILFEMQLHLHRSWSDVIGKWQRALPVARGIRSSEMFKDGPCISIGQRRGGNFRQLCGLFRRRAVGIGQRGDGGNARARGIARKFEHVANGSALHTGVGAPWALGIFVSAAPAVVGGIGIDDQASSAVLLCDECLHPAEVLAITHQHDLAARIDFHLFQLLEIFRGTIIGVHGFRLDVARR